MKRLRILFPLTIVYILLVSMIFVGTASAYDVKFQVTNTPVPTVTITAPPPYVPVMPTTPAYSDLSCPAGTPVGMGTLTPSYDWELFCGQCLITPYATSTLRPAATWDGTGTPPSTSTATITSTPTLTLVPTVTATTSGGTATFDDPLSGFQGLSGNAYANMNASTYSCTPVEGTSGIKTVTCDVHFSGIDNYSTAASNASFSLYMKLAPSTTYWRWQYVELSSPVGVTVQFKKSSTSGPLIASTGTSGPGVQEAIVVQLNGVNSFVGATSYNVRMTLSTEPIAGPTATPTITPTLPAYTYCDVIQDESASSAFSWSGISFEPVSPNNCFDLGPYGGFDFGGLTSNPVLAFPWLAHICFQNVDLGVLVVFGVQVALSTIAYVGAAVMLVRNMFVS